MFWPLAERDLEKLKTRRTTMIDKALKKELNRDAYNSFLVYVFNCEKHMQQRIDKLEEMKRILTILKTYEFVSLTNRLMNVIERFEN